MLQYILHLSIEGIFRKKKSSILTFLVLLTSFSFIIVALSIVGSISKTNAEYRLNTYGEWSFAVLPANGLESTIRKLEQVEGMGRATCYGTFQSSNGSIGIGAVDDDFLQIGRIVLEDGRFPEAEMEIAMAASTLSALGYDYTLGQEITVFIERPSNAQPEGPLPPEPETFVLCGVIREFHSLWCIGARNEQQILVSAFVTPDTGKAIARSAGTAPSSQLFLNVARENWQVLQDWFVNELGEFALSQYVFINRAAYPDSVQAIPPDSFYTGLIGLISLVAVFSVFFLQMRDSYHSYAVCRSVGMTKKQLALLLALETLLLVLPAVVLGTLLGGALTFLSLRLLLYSGSAPIQVDIPMGTLAVVTLLWAVCAIGCRLVLFFITSRSQLTGAFQLSHAKSVRIRRLTKAAIFCLTTLFGTALAFTWMGALTPWYTIQRYSNYPDYWMIAAAIIGDPYTHQLVPRRTAKLMEEIPGISYVSGMGESPIGVSFPGMEEVCAWLYDFDGDEWDITFDFGKDREAFLNGDLVLLTLPKDGSSDLPIPDGDITLHFLPTESISRDTIWEYDYEDITQRSQSDDGCMMEITTPVSIRILPKSTYVRNVADIRGPYTVICSDKFLENALSRLGPGEKWDVYTGGDEFGYYEVQAGADLNSGSLSTDRTIAKFCADNDLPMLNFRQEWMAYRQGGLQDLILMLSCGGCVTAISLLLLCSLLQLEATQEKKAFAILRMIGMSRRQMRSRILIRSVGSCVLAAAVGSLCYVCYTVLYMLHGEADIAELLAKPGFTWNLVTPLHLILLLSACVIAPLVCFLAAKLGAMRKGGDFE